MRALSATAARTTLEHAAVVFWDFDGVVKDSVTVKTEGYVRLFASYGADIAARVRAHHEANGGVSRYDKIPLYMGWVGEDASPARARHFCDRFSELVLQAVLDSPWVPGVREYLQEHCSRQQFVLVTATPLDEIRVILGKLRLDSCFARVYGAPTQKADAIRTVLLDTHTPRAAALMVGDSNSDYAAAVANNINFLLRRTSLNHDLQTSYAGLCFEDLGDEQTVSG